MDESRDVDPCENFVIQNECNNLSYNKCCRSHIRMLASMYWTAYTSFILSLEILRAFSIRRSIARSLAHFTHFSQPSSFWMHKTVVYVCVIQILIQHMKMLKWKASRAISVENFVIEFYFPFQFGWHFILWVFMPLIRTGSVFCCCCCFVFG